MKTEDKSCNNCGHHYQNGQRCNARPCRSGDKWKAIAPKPEQPREQENSVNIPKWQMIAIEDVLRQANNIHHSQKKETCFDRCICKAWKWACDALGKEYSFESIAPKPDTSQVEKFTNIPTMTTTGESKRDNTSQVEQTAEEILKQFAKYFNNESYGSIEGWIVEDFVRDELSQYPTINAQSPAIDLRKELINLQEHRKYGIPEDNGDHYLTRFEVAKIFKITLTTLNKWTKKGVIPSCKIGYRILYKSKDIYKSRPDIKTVSDEEIEEWINEIVLYIQKSFQNY